MRVFTDDGDAIPVTVLDVSNNRVAQVKTAETDGYNALQIVSATTQGLARQQARKPATWPRRASSPAK